MRADSHFTLVCIICRALSVVLGTSACAATTLMRLPGPAPESPTRPAAVAAAAPAQHETERPGLPADWPLLRQHLTLAQALDVALANSPDTRVAYFAARAQAAQLGIARAAYFPSVELDGTAGYAQIVFTGALFKYRGATDGPAVNLSWLLLDLGGRSAGVASAKASLAAASWSFDGAISDLILRVTQSFYNFASDTALYQAALVNQKDAEENLHAAQERKSLGAATLADVLQAKTALSQAILATQTQDAKRMISRLTLVAAMGIGAAEPIDIGVLPDVPAAPALTENVEKLLEQALAERPEVNSARYAAQAASAQIKVARSAALPSLVGVANANRAYFQLFAPPPASDHGDSWSGQLTLRVPLFSGLSDAFNIDKATELANQANEHVRSVAEQTALDVWTSYYNLSAAAQRVQTGRDLVESATEAENVVLGRYKAGAGSVLDVLASQAALASARSEEIQARADWFLALAALTHATGSLTPWLEAREDQ